VTCVGIRSSDQGLENGKRQLGFVNRVLESGKWCPPHLVNFQIFGSVEMTSKISMTDSMYVHIRIVQQGIQVARL
jgi:hypothetical protein